MPIDLPPILTHALEFTTTFQYFLIAIGAIIEGPILMIASGFLLRLGHLSFWPLFVALFIGEMIGDLGWYYLGQWVGGPIFARHGKFVGVTPEQFESLKASFTRNPKKVLLLSKLTMGFGFAVGVLMVAGATRYKLKKFYIVNGIGEVGYLMMMLGIGFFFGHLYESIQGVFKYSFLAAGIIAGLLALYGFSRYIKRNRARLLT